MSIATSMNLTLTNIANEVVVNHKNSSTDEKSSVKWVDLGKIPNFKKIDLGQIPNFQKIDLGQLLSNK